MYSRPDKSIKTEPELLPQESKREIELFEKLFRGTEEINNKYSIGKYWPDPVKLPKLFNELGFKKVEIDAIAIPIAIDDSRNSYEKKIAIVKAEMQQVFESIELGVRLNNNGLTANEISELKKLVSDRFDKRINLINEQLSIWDYTILIMQIVSGVV